MARGVLRRAADRADRQIRSLLRIGRAYRVGGVRLVLPPDHLMPEYRADHPLYDRFLPHLAKHLPPRSNVIDVGANVGYTLADMAAANPELSFLCVEADDEIFRYLERNTRVIRSRFPDTPVRIVKALAGRGLNVASLKGGGGSRHAVISTSGGAPAMAMTPLDALAMEASGPVSLIKSDVDGFDYDVLASAGGLIERHRPLIYFECQPDSAEQFKGYTDCLAMLGQLGYTRFAVFDNFGNLMPGRYDSAQVVRMMRGLNGAKPKHSASAIDYLDILAYPPEQDGLTATDLDAYPG